MRLRYMAVLPALLAVPAVMAQADMGDFTVGEIRIEGLQRITWDGTAPVEILTQRLTERGFDLTFTVPMGAAASAAQHYRFKRFRYDHHALDGSLRRE